MDTHQQLEIQLKSAPPPQQLQYHRAPSEETHDIFNEDEETKENILSSEEDMKEQILSIFDGDNNIATKELDDKDTTLMIKTQKEFESFSKLRCGHKLFVYAKKMKVIIFNIVFFFAGLMIAEFGLRGRNDKLYTDVWFYTMYFSFMIFWISIARLFAWLIMHLLRKLIKNSWSIFYIRNIRKRIYLAILSILWFIALDIIADLYNGYEYNENIFLMVQCILISSLAFLASHVFIRYVALNSYFNVFRQRTRKIKAYFTMMEIMLSLSPKKSLFCIPIMNFLIDFPTHDQTQEAKKENRKSVSFKFDTSDIKMTKEEQEFMMVKFDTKAHIVGNISRPKSVSPVPIDNERQTAKSPKTKFGSELVADINEDIEANIVSEENIKLTKIREDAEEENKDYGDNNNDNGSKSYHIQPLKGKRNTDDSSSSDSESSSDEDENGGPFEDEKEVQHIAMEELLNTNLFSVYLHKSNDAQKIISKDKMNRLSMLLSYLIYIRLHVVKKKLLKKGRYQTKTFNNLLKQENLAEEKKRRKEDKKHKRNDSGSLYGLETLRSYLTKRGSEHEDKFQMAEAAVKDCVNEDCFMRSFRRYAKRYKLNKEILKQLGQLAWKKFSDDDTDKDTPQITAPVLNINIRKIMDDLLKLKQSIDSYIIIINNLQQMIDVITPILLLFVYLYIFNFDFQQTLTLYVSSVGIIGFFGSSYFSSVFASVSFIIALNPFLVGDYVHWKGDTYRVREISLISCTFKQLSTGYFYTFQNKQLGASKDPIVNRSRSGVMKYRFTLYFQSGITNEELYKFAKECSKEIDRVREKELDYLHNKKKRDYFRDDEAKWNGYCTFSELKSLDYKSVIFRSVQLDEYGRKKVFIEMKYETYSWNVRTMCFNCITKVANKKRFKKYLADTLPISLDKDDDK